MKKQFYQICGIDTTATDFINEGYQVINIGMVKSSIMEILKDKETANKYHLWNEITEPTNNEMLLLKRKLETIVFKESRGNSQNRAIGWENGESYLRYHSGIIYKWFK